MNDTTISAPMNISVSDSVNDSANNSIDGAEMPTLTPAAELAAAIAELEQYRERLVKDTLDATQRAKLMKSAAMARLEPELAQIDAMLASAKAQLAALER
jgi:capsule polysaccharide export protein KpsE/RkpR